VTRLRRCILNALGLLSLLLCVLTAGLWARSYHVPDSVGHSRCWATRQDGKLIEHRASEYFESHKGSLRIGFSRIHGRPDTLGWIGPRDSVVVVEYDSWAASHDGADIERRPGLFIERGAPPTPGQWGDSGFWLYLGIPYWLLTALLLPLPSLCLVRFLRLRVKGVGCCRACGYDLRATPGRCPECGETPTRLNA
jgi:hypothetical protein